MQPPARDPATGQFKPRYHALIERLSGNAPFVLVAPVLIGLIGLSTNLAGVLTMDGARVCLFLAWLVGIISIATVRKGWNPSRLHRGVAIGALSLVLGGLYFYELRHQPAPIAVAQQKEDMARRWIKLSDEIFTDLPTLNMEFHRIDPNLPNDVRHREWLEDSERELEHSRTAMARMSQKYQSRLEQARMEMESLNLSPRDNNFRRDMHVVVNSFDWQYWAADLGANGKGLLIQLGKGD